MFRGSKTVSCFHFDWSEPVCVSTEKSTFMLPDTFILPNLYARLVCWAVLLMNFK